MSNTLYLVAFTASGVILILLLLVSGFLLTKISVLGYPYYKLPAVRRLIFADCALGIALLGVLVYLTQFPVTGSEELIVFTWLVYVLVSAINALQFNDLKQFHSTKKHENQMLICSVAADRISSGIIAMSIFLAVMLFLAAL